MSGSDSDDEMPVLVESITHILPLATTNPTKSSDAGVFKELVPVPDSASATPLLSKPVKPVPVTILTGPLGSGKTTLLSNILAAISKPSIKKAPSVAILMNEVGESNGIDKELVSSRLASSNTSSEIISDWVDLANGCICCSIKDAGFQAVEAVVERAAEKGNYLDYIILETSGVADPVSLVRTFWPDAEIEPKAFIDGIITLVDAKHAMALLAQPSEDGISSPEQITFLHQLALSDRIIINKTDLVHSSVVEDLEAHIRPMASSAHIYKTTFSNVPLDVILDTNSYDPTRWHHIPMSDASTTSSFASVIATHAVVLPSPISQDHIDKFLQQVLWAHLHSDSVVTYDILRTKGIFYDGSEWVVVQGVRDLYDMTVIPHKIPGPSRNVVSPGDQPGRLVFIGTGVGPWLSLDFHQFVLNLK